MTIIKKLLNITTLNLQKELPLDVLIKLLVTNILSIVVIISATIFVFISLNNGAIYLSYFLLGLIIIHIINFTIFFWKKNINITKYTVVLSVELLFIILLINGGNVGYGYLWFYGFPLISLYIIGNKIGKYINLSFLLILICTLIIPKEYISHEYNNSLLLRLIISYFTFSIVIYIIIEINEKIILDLKRKLSKKNQNFDEKSKLFEQLAKESKIAFNNLIKTYNKNLENNNTDILKLENLQNSNINLINIINNIVEISEYKPETKEFEPSKFNLLKTIVNTILIFKSKKFIINIKYSKNIPNIIMGNPIKIKQVLFNILKTISEKTNNNCIIDITVEQNSNNKHNIRFIVLINKNIIKSKKQTFSYNNILLSSVNENIIKLNLEYTNKIIIESGGYMYINNSSSNTTIKLSCNFTNVNTDTNKLNNVLLQKSTIHSKNRYLSDEIISKINVLFVDNDTLNKKLGEIELKTKFNNIIFADSYKEAIKKFTKNKFDLIITNSIINNEDCINFVKKITDIEFGLKLKVKVIVIENNEVQINKETLVEYGVIGFTNKNIKVEKIIQIIRES